MIFFSSRPKRNCLSAHTSKRKYRLETEFAQPNDPNHAKNVIYQQDKQNFSQVHPFHQGPESGLDPYKEQMKFLIEKNSDYFQNKVKITDKVRPNQYRFKIPTKTPATVYKHHYPLKDKDLSVDNVKLNRNNLSQTIKIKDSEQKFPFKSTYQNQFTLKKQSLKNRRNSLSKSKKIQQQQTRQQESAPMFTQTQNKCVYLNWGGINSVTSLKPTYQTVATNFPFNAKTIYKNDFQGKTVAPSKLVVPESSITKLSSSLMISKSSYAMDFSKYQRRGEVQKSCKPKHIPVKMCSSLKGATEYRSEFVSSKQMQGCISRNMSKQELHALILDL